MTIKIGKKNIYEKNGGFFSRLEQEPCWHFEQGTGRHAAASRPSMLVILVTPRVCGTSFQDPQAQKKTRRRMARERRAGSSLVSLETPYYKTIY